MKKVALVGLRHPHIVTLLDILKADSSVEIVAICESDCAAIANAEENWGLKVTHNDFEEMLSSVDFDILAIGDYYGVRGRLAIAGLNAGKHIVADKPLCTSLDELSEIERIAKEKALCVGLMLDFRTHGNVLAAKSLIDAGDIGEVYAINFGGQHPLNYGTRQGWYFEEGKHGGTINDIAIHALDVVEFITSSPITKLTAAQMWNAKADLVPNFKDSAQVMFALENKCGVTGDVSYLAPENIGYTNSLYWRFTIWGRDGVLEFNYFDEGCKLYASGAKEPKLIAPLPEKHNFWQIFSSEIDGNNEPLGTAHVIKITEKCLKLQNLA